jgi:hypothetical protein
MLVASSAGCAHGAAPKTPASPAAGPVAAAAPLIQDRLDETTGMITAPLRSSEPVRVVSVQLVSPYFAPAAAREFGQQLEAGRRVDFPVPFGAVRCPAGAEPTELVIVVVGTPEPLHLKVEPGGLTRLHEKGCQAQEFEKALTVEWGPGWTQVAGHPAHLRGELRLRRTVGADVQLTAIQGSVLYDLAAAGPLPRISGDGDGGTALPVEIGVRLCSKHGLTEAKKVFDFTLSGRLGTGDVRRRTITPPPAVQAAARTLLATCPDE